MEDNIIYIGTKPVMNYVLAVVTQFNTGIPEVIIKARGNAIIRAIDTAELICRKFIPSAQKKNITISTDTIDSDDGPVNVSSIQIILSF